MHGYNKVVSSTQTSIVMQYVNPDFDAAYIETIGNADWIAENYYAYLGVPSIYSQFRTKSDGSWIQNANWTEDPTYSYDWHFKNDGSIDFPYQSSNYRTGFGDTLKFATSIDQAIIAGPDSTETSPTAERLVIAGADGYMGSTGEGGDIYLWAGRGGEAGGSGGDIKLDGGNGQATGEGGTVKMRGGYSPNGNGGFVEIYSGSSGSGNGGFIDIASGTSNTGIGGNITITANSNGKITLNGSGGEFLNDSSNPNNQIATIGDIGSGSTTGDIFYSTNNGNGTNYKVGDDAWIGDINAADHIAIMGVETNTNGGIIFGSNHTESISTDGSNLSLVAGNDIILNPGSNYAYIGTPAIDGSNRIATLGDIKTNGSWDAAFTDSTGTLAGINHTGHWNRVGNMIFFCVNVTFNGYTNLGTGQYQFNLPFAPRQTFTSRGGTLHNPNTDSKYHIAAIVDTAVSTTIAKLYYSGSTTDLAWKYNTPVGWADNTSHFDISGFYEIAP
jgi:hypothetical protein